MHKNQENFRSLYNSLSTEMGIDDPDVRNLGQIRIFANQLIHRWYHNTGDSYVFVFRQNLRNTNLQYAEFLSLLRLNIRNRDGIKSFKASIMFASGRELENALTEYLDYINEHTNSSFLDVVEQVYRKLNDIVLINAFYGTAIIMMDESKILNFAQIVIHSGYIHSCGRLILMNSSVTLNAEKIYNTTKKYLRKNYSLPVLVRPYCHEDFTPYDKSADFLVNGLDDIKFYMSKAMVGSAPLSSVLESAITQLDDQYTVHLAEAGHFKDSRADFIDELGSEKFSTWFLINDSNVDPTSRHPKDHKVYILYEQLLMNLNQLHWFDENKPAWVSHTTLPHTMTSALLNIVRAGSRNIGDNIKIVDPFGGSGTLFLEALKYHDILAHSFDLSPASERMITDNIEFFNFGHSEFNKLIKQLKSLPKEFKSVFEHPESRSNDSARKQGIKVCWRLSQALFEICDGNFLDLEEENWTEVDAEVRGNDRKWTFYVMVRALVRHRMMVDSEREGLPEALEKETEKLLDAVIRISQAAGGAPAVDSDLSGVQNECFQVCEYKYSMGIRCKEEIFAVHDLFGVKGVFGQRNLYDLAPHSYDAVVFDPPYGFNTDEGLAEIEELFSKIPDILVKSLRGDFGQVIAVLPDVSFTGRPLPPFVKKEFFIAEMTRAANRHGFQLLAPAAMLPSEISNVRPPYYWYSERALKRVILHFSLRRIVG